MLELTPAIIRYRYDRLAAVKKQIEPDHLIGTKADWERLFEKHSRRHSRPLFSPTQMSFIKGTRCFRPNRWSDWFWLVNGEFKKNKICPILANTFWFWEKRDCEKPKIKDSDKINQKMMRQQIHVDGEANPLTHERVDDQHEWPQKTLLLTVFASKLCNNLTICFSDVQIWW